jgi:hypothetical protein
MERAGRLQPKTSVRPASNERDAKGTNSGDLQFVDNRPAASAQRRTAAAMNSHQNPAAQFQNSVDRSRQATQIAQLSTILQPVQLKGEFKSRFQKHPDFARAALAVDSGGYATFQKQFEVKLGAGLYTNPEALAGATAMLTKMEAAMKAAGIGDKDINKSFAIRQGEELGGVLEEDVRSAIASGNIREKMGMVYQARFKIAEALDILRKQENPTVALGPEIRSREMGKAIDELTKDKKASAYAVLKRRQSVDLQDRSSNTKPKQETITGEYLEELGVPLSDREKKAAKEKEVNGKSDRRFVPGSEYYVVPPKKRDQEQALLRRVVSGLSGSTDMYFHIAKHLDMNESERKQLRLAALAQMIVNNDHSYHEIMHVAKTQGELADYPDDLPIGYTTLAPLTEDNILTAAGLPDFPGDEQVRKAPGELATTREAVVGKGGGPAKRSHRYAGILAKIAEYHQNPKIESLADIIRRVDDWMSAKKPGPLSFKSTEQQWEASQRRLALVDLRAEAELLQKVESEYLKLDLEGAKTYIADLLANAPKGGEAVVHKKAENFVDSYIARMTKEARLGGKLKGDQAVKAQDELKRKTDDLNKIKVMLTGTGENWQSKDFRAKKSVMDLDLSNVDIADTGIYGDLEGSTLKANAKQTLTDYTMENRNIIEDLGGDVSDFPDLAKKPSTQMEKILHARKRKKDKEATQSSAKYKQDPQDFLGNIDTSMVEALAPGTPMDMVLRQMEGKPVPAELEAINLYAQPGFYTMMNKVLNNSHKKEYMKQVPQEAKDLISLAVSGLRKMQPYKGGGVFRGQPGLNTDYVKNTLTYLPKTKREDILRSTFGGAENYSQFVSTAKRPYESYSTKDNKWLAMEIRNVKTGVDISAISNTLYEREVLFPPGATFTPTLIEDKFVTKTKGSDKWGDLPNRFNEGPINSGQEGRVKVVYDEA